MTRKRPNRKRNRKRNKYGVDISEAGKAARTRDGHTFDSLAEMRRYCDLKLMEQSGEIANLKLQPKFPLVVNGLKIATYKADFRYTCVKTGRVVIEDVKGRKTAIYNMKKKLMRAIHGVEIHEVQT